MKSEPGTRGSLFPAKAINTRDRFRLARELSSKEDAMSQALYRNIHCFQGVQLFSPSVVRVLPRVVADSNRCWQKEMYSWNLALFSDHGLTMNR